MLLSHDTLQRIATGEVTVAFRRWKRPSVRAGGTLRTAVGVLKIRRVDEISSDQITPQDARRAGYASLAELQDFLAARETGTLYRIQLAWHSDDPRVALRKQSRISADQRAELLDRLARLDAVSRRGPWTRAVLRAIDRQPHVPAGELAVKLGFDRAWLKLQVRKLKELGLTESLQPGYRLSPRGRALLPFLR